MRKNMMTVVTNGREKSKKLLDTQINKGEKEKKRKKKMRMRKRIGSCGIIALKRVGL